MIKNTLVSQLLSFPLKLLAGRVVCKGMLELELLYQGQHYKCIASQM